MVGVIFSTRVCVCVCVQGASQWYELQDLHVQDLLPQMITLAEAYIQVPWSCDHHVTGVYDPNLCHIPQIWELRADDGPAITSSLTD